MSAKLDIVSVNKLYKLKLQGIIFTLKFGFVSVSHFVKLYYCFLSVVRGMNTAKEIVQYCQQKPMFCEVNQTR